MFGWWTDFLDWWATLKAKLFPVRYEEYLNTRKWKNKRYRTLRKAKYRCQINQSHIGRMLHVHHNTYKRLGYERPRDLIVVCDSCHGTIHNTQMFPRGRKKNVRKIVVNDAYPIEVDY